MAFKTKKEKSAFRAGLIAGSRKQGKNTSNKNIKKKQISRYI